MNSPSVSCTHYWEKGGTLVASGKDVGTDVGIPPDQSFSTKGTYLCQVEITKEVVAENKYLFLGEIGDASYVEVLTVDGKYVRTLPITHGLSPDPNIKPVYTRYIPFVISLRDLYVVDGVHSFKVRYQDLFPFQVGLRSGPPTVESVDGAVLKALATSKSFIWYFSELLFLGFLAVWIITLSNIQFLRRVLLLFTTLFSAIVILQITALPRTFLPIPLAIWLNDMLRLISFPIYSVLFFSFFKTRENSLRNTFLFVQIWGTIAAVSLLSFNHERTVAYLFRYATCLVLLGGLPFIIAGILVLRNRILFTAAPEKPSVLASIYIALGSIFVLDFFNLAILQSRYNYLQNYLFFSGMMTMFWQLQNLEDPADIDFRAKIEVTKKNALKLIARTDVEDADILKKFTWDLASIIKAERVSLSEVVDGKIRFFGIKGFYTNTHGLSEMGTESLSMEAVKSNEIKTAVRGTENETSDVVVIPLNGDNGVVGIFCASNFEHGRISPFFVNRLDTLKNEVEPILNLALASKQLKAKDRLIQMMRNRVHSLQLESEQFFLKNFDMASGFGGHTFIFADLVDSVGLNERYRNQGLVEKTIDEHLKLVWERFKNLGIILSRTRGDLISIIVPDQSIDINQSDGVKRCQKIMEFLATSSEQFQKIAKSNGIGWPMHYRFAMSRVRGKLTSSDNDMSLKPFTLLVDEAIDAAARVINAVAVTDECILMEPVFPFIERGHNIIEMPPERLKGKGMSVRLLILLASHKNDAA